MAVWLTLSVSQGTPNETARTNTVTASVKVHYSGGSYNGNSPSGMLTIDGQSFDFTCNFNYAGIGQGAVTTGTGSVTACTQTVTVPYGSSTTKTVYVYASFASGTTSGTVTANDSITLTSISAGGSSGGGDDGGDDWEDPDNPGSGGGSGGSGDSVSPPFESNVSNNYFYADGSGWKSPIAVVGYDAQGGHAQALNFVTDLNDVGSRSISVDIAMKASVGNGTQTIGIALCSESGNSPSYGGANLDVYDPYQIAVDTITLTDGQYSTISIPTSALTGGTECYLILWIPPDYNEPDSPYSLDFSDGIEIRVNYTSDGGNTGDDGGDDSGDGDDIVTPTTKGVFYIDNGIEYTAYQCYIDNGTSWDPVGGEGGYSRNTGSITLTSASQSVSCGFTPDVVVLTGLSYTSSSSGQPKELQLTAVFTEKTTANTLRATAYNDDTEWIEVEITQTATGFSLANFYAIDDDGYTDIPSMQFNYVAIKYT